MLFEKRRGIKSKTSSSNTRGEQLTQGHRAFALNSRSQRLLPWKVSQQDVLVGYSLDLKAVSGKYVSPQKLPQGKTWTLTGFSGLTILV